MQRRIGEAYGSVCTWTSATAGRSRADPLLDGARRPVRLDELRVRIEREREEHDEAVAGLEHAQASRRAARSPR